ncbi:MULTISPECIES: hypothetical protein [unclassified Caballeronia]|uniref:hypothetical protein n=1 Tax=unclassified Caballeronia TaxID=2646786 RepID=UPI001F419F6E|nr:MULTISPECIES: hypothetical protein [unclassified Caballeronia]MCE4544628.1 hypothetical protein [Caballeronia sp. PC1]MCE4571780.1 hypothetical protein [Caballeronia sp. CLC5]
MKERPILFSASMVRALLDGRKTQTRRVIKDQTIGENYSHTLPDGRVHLEWLGEPCCGTGVWEVPELSDQTASPYGVIGDRLWVRETFSTDFRNHYPFDDVWYAADDDRRNEIEVRDGVKGIYSPEHREHVPFRWRPSIHMPRAASRITLEITGVRVERLQDISEQDAKVEGVSVEGDGDPIYPHTYAFAKLWEEINGKGAWLADPWVWVVEFRRVES